MKKLVIIDAHGYIHRAYHALPPLTTSKGESINAVYGFTRMILKLIAEQKADYYAVCFDSPGPTFRHKLDPNYKATRKETDKELKSQFPLTREVISAMEIAAFEMDGYEADDLIATLAKKAEKDGIEILIVSGDKDLLQLVNDHIHVLSEPKQYLFNIEKVVEKWGVKPDQVRDVLTLMGDSSDNIPGVPGVGDKTAVKLIQEFGSVDHIFSHLDKIPGKLSEKIKNSKEQIEKSRKMVSLDSTVPLNVLWDQCRLKPLNPNTIEPLFRRWEFHKLLTELYSKNLLTAPAKKIDESNREYQIILEIKDLKNLMSILQSRPYFALDVETTGLNPRNCELVGISFAWEKGQAAYIPLQHHYLGAPKQIDLKKVLEIIAPVLTDSSVQKIGHNLKFDYSVILRHGIKIETLNFDTMIASYCLDPSKSSHGLKNLVYELLGVQMTRFEEFGGVPLDQIEIERTAPYASADADYTLQLYGCFSKSLKEKGLETLFQNLEMPLIKILADMEATGIKVDAGHLKELDVKFSNMIVELEQKVYGLAGQEFNLNSPKQLSFILFEKLKLPVIKKTKTGFSTDENVLIELSSMHDLPSLLMQHREIAKLKSTYIDGLLNAVNSKTGRIHTSFNQTGTATGRFSSSDPNLQNIPIRTEYGKMIRSAFIPDDGQLFLSFDYSQIDLRVLAHLSGDPHLIEAFKEGADIHRSTAAEIAHIKPDEVSQEQRKNAKAVNFGIVYGQQAYGLSQSLKIPIDEAQKMIDQYFIKYPKVKEWIDQTIQQARINGSVKTLLGRVRLIPDINAKNGSIRSFAERIAVNTPVQGTSADIIKSAMIKIQNKLWCDASHLKPRMLVQVHDDLLFEVPNSETNKWVGLIKHEMESAVQLSVPIIVDVKAGKNWAELKPYS